MTLWILGLALEILGKRRRAVLGAILLPAILMVAVDTFGLRIVQATGSALIYLIAELAVYSWLAIAIHRVVLLNDTFRIRWGWRETRFAGWLMVMGFGVGLAHWAFVASFESIGMPSNGFVGTTFELLVALAILYWASQYFLIFPAIAVDRQYSASHSAVDTEDYRFTTFMVVAVFPVLLSLVELPASLISNVMLYSLVRSLLSIISVTVGVAMLSVLYRELAQ